MPRRIRRRILPRPSDSMSGGAAGYGSYSPSSAVSAKVYAYTRSFSYSMTSCAVFEVGNKEAARGLPPLAARRRCVAVLDTERFAKLVLHPERVLHGDRDACVPQHDDGRVVRVLGAVVLVVAVEPDARPDDRHPTVHLGRVEQHLVLSGDLVEPRLERRVDRVVGDATRPGRCLEAERR